MKGLMRASYDGSERMERDRIAKRVYVGECEVVVQLVGHGRDGLIP